MTAEQPILIVSTRADNHAGPVAWALERMGVDAVVWDWARFPVDSALAAWLDPEDAAGDGNLIEGRVLPAEIGTIWYRRQGIATPCTETDDADRNFVELQSNECVRSILSSMNAALWVNHPGSARVAEHKLVQLRAAREIGFAIPETLVTNSPAKVEAFRRGCKGNVVFKAFLPMTWRDSSQTDHFVETTLVPPRMALDPDAILLCPAIYQREVRKQYELRVTVMGNDAVALKLESQAREYTVDWRIAEALGKVPSQIVDLDAALRDKCIRVCRRLGLQFGAIDIIVDAAGDPIFVEVNQAGNFLFLDDARGEARALQRFCAFLTGYEGDLARLPSLSEFRSSGSEREWLEKAAGDRARGARHDLYFAHE